MANGIKAQVFGGGGCSAGTCVDVTPIEGGVRVESTLKDEAVIAGNTGQVTFTAAEWDAFIGQVKAGQWDYTVSGALVA